MTTELETLIPPQQEEITIAGKRLSLAPFGLRKSGQVMRELRPVLREFTSSDINLVSLVTDHTEALISAVRVALDEDDDEWVAGLDLANFVRLAGWLWEMNKDFFTRSVLSEISRTWPGFAAQPTLAETAGQTPFNA